LPPDGLRALIVDDDPSFQLALAESVRHEGFSTATAGSLAEARQELARGGAPDVLFIDFDLPDGSGLELLREMEAPPETVLITGHTNFEAAVEALRRGVADYLTKPVDFTRVQRVLALVTRARELKDEIGNLRGELRRLGRSGPKVD
jgi:DNA-binding NtrC family response regulator